MAFQPQVQYKNDDLVRRKLNPEPKALRWTLKQECTEQVKLQMLHWARREPISAQLEDKPPYNLRNCPASLLQDVFMSILGDESNSQPLKKVAEQLLGNGLEEFDFKCIDDIPFDQLGRIFAMVKLNGNNFKCIRLVGRWTYSSSAPNMVRDILQNCPNLERCVLQEANYEDILCAARHCPRLIKLDVLLPSLSQKDVVALQAIARKKKFRVGRSLRSLTLPASVDGSSLLSMLELFPEVVDLTCVDLEGLMVAASEAGPSAVARCAKMFSLRVTHVMGWKSVETLVNMFPNLERLSLKTQEIMNIQHLVNLERLTALRLENSQVIPSSYTEDVLPLLREIGHHLVHLGLIHFNVIELSKTHSYCPNLHSLDLQQFTLLGCTSDRFRRLHHGTQRAYDQLRSLRMRPRQGKCVPQEACLLLLKHCHRLTYLELHEAYGMTDALASVLAQYNGFSELLRIRLRGGHQLSRLGIETLLYHATQLRHCHIR
ncbi:hypothetical protein BIW11_00698 [Tropilaelaps mercedesae]|uniref:F-box/LRR-repeat protein 7-like n=1 Tax=Tropilaelaps mercedesae TaxID=418985 RepID=A0A1V9XQW7_9ACAR|nr:hypothetical protein BIW11_00698 [Tropilaelaps mercedesae]